MRIFNQEKTKELTQEALDFEKGSLKDDKIFVAHYEAVPFKKGRTAEEIAQELIEQGAVVEKGFEDKFYKVVKEYEGGGREVKEIEDEPDIQAKEAYDEYEDIQVYVPYTELELEERRLDALRNDREPLLIAFDKWEKAVLRGRELDDTEIMDWYKDLLDLKDSAFVEIPKRVEYYL